MSESPSAAVPTDDSPDGSDSAADELQAQLRLLEEENERLRRAYAQQRRTEYQRAAIALAAVGVVSVGAAALFPSVRTVLIVVGAIGLFGGIITRYLTPERFVAADVGERVFTALAGNEAAIAAELGLQLEYVYVPVGDGEAGSVRLFVPEHEEYTIPDPADLEQTFVVTDDQATRGLAVTPTGDPLYQEYSQSAVASADDAVSPVVEALSEALVESFEIAASVTTEVTAGDGRVVVDVTGSVFSDGTAFDDPVVSLLAVGLAHTVDAPIRTEASPTEQGYTVTYEWTPAADGDDAVEGPE